MKIKRLSWYRQDEGSALLMAMFVTMVILPVIAVYVLCSQNQYQAVARSNEWNASLSVVEAGIEEAFAHLNRNCYPNWANNGVLRPFDWDGWTKDTTDPQFDIYTAPRRYISENSLGGSYYEVWVEVAKNVPMVLSASWPAAQSWSSVRIRCAGYSPILISQSTGPSFANIGSERASIGYVGRQLRVDARQKPLFDKGQVTGGDAKGNGQYLLDAFDSMDNSHSFYGVYDPNYRLPGGGTIASIGGTIDLGANGVVYGSGETSSSGDIINGTIGDAAWIEGGNTGAQPGAASNDLNEPPLEKVELPDANWITLLACNCPIAYTNPAVEFATVQSSTLPTPLPSGEISTNNAAWIYGSLTWPATVPPASIQTNIVGTTSDTYISPGDIANLVDPPGIITNSAGGGSWFTNWAANETSAPIYPTSYASSPGVIVGTKVVTNSLASPPPEACRVGDWSYVYQGGGQNPDRQKINGVWYTTYVYTWKEYYAYKVPESYSWSYYTYNYPSVIYTYVGTNLQSSVETNTFKYVVGNGQYKVADLSLSGGERMLIRGNATIYVSGSMTMSGRSQIIILKGATLTFYFGGDVSLGGQGIVNRNDNALNLTMYGLPTCTDISISGNAGFTGALYAPDADITLNGGGSDSFDIVGALAGKTVTANGSFGVHYDINLARKGPTKGYIAAGWVEERVGTP